MRFGLWVGPILRTHRAGKGHGVCGGWGLGSRNRRGPGVPPTPGLRGQETSPGRQQASWARVGRANALLSSPAPPVWEGPSCLTLLISPQSPSNAPKDTCGLEGVWRAGDWPGSSAVSLGQVGRAIALCSSPAPPGWLLQPASPDLPSLLLMPLDPHSMDGALEGWGTSLGAQQAPWPEWARRLPSTPLQLFPESPSHLPLLIYPAPGVPILSGLHFSSPLSLDRKSVV